MMTNDRDSSSEIISLFQNPGFQNETAQIKAKALLTEILQDVPQYEWSYIAQRVVRNITFAAFQLENIAREEPSRMRDFSNVARELALVWESLAKLNEATTEKTALINAAINYELAGYQANAMCIAGRLDSEINPEEPSLVSIASLFIQRRFLQLTSEVKVFQQEPQSESTFGTSLIYKIGFALASKAFTEATVFFLQGAEQSLADGLQNFQNAENIFASLGLVEETNLTRSMRSLLAVMRGRSTWSLLGDLLPQQPKWCRYLKLLARGAGLDVYRSRSISELWDSQITALQCGLLSSEANKIVKMPTSAGKTRIAELSIVHTLLKYQGAKCIYVAPYRALVSELEQSFLNLVRDLGFRISSIAGAYESDDFEELLLQEADLLVTTPEKLDLLLRAKPEFLEMVRLFVLDEVHFVDSRKRGVKFEILLTRLKRKLPNARILALSAVVPQVTIEDFAAWFNASLTSDVMTSSWRPSIQRYAKFEWSGATGVLRYASDRDIQGLQEFVPGVIREQSFRYRHPQTGRQRTIKFPDKSSRAEIAAELAFKFAELGPVLIFCAQPNFVKAVAKALMKKKEFLQLTQQNIPYYFALPSDARSTILAGEWLAGSEFEDWCRSGIGVHYGSLPDVIRKAVETDFRQRKLRILVATNTLAQGVNLPVRTVIVHGCRRYDSINQTQERIPARDYWNIAGRAGRAGEETEGLIIHLKIDSKDETDFQYYLRRRENVEEVEGALYQSLIELLQGRLSEEALKAEINPEVLALLVEESSIFTGENSVSDFLSESLVNFQAQRHEQTIQELVNVFRSTASNILEQVNDPQYREVYSSTGLSTVSCKQIREHVESNEQQLREMFINATLENLEQMVELFLPISLSLSEIHLESEFGGSYSELLQKWLEGVEIKELVSEFANQASSTEEFGRFIDDLFGYRLPWGISAYIRIALQVLDIQRTSLTDIVKFFPSMVKYGLPDPVACWAMSAGVPIRRTALIIASAYRNESQACTYEEFLRWLTTLSSERLYYEFGLESPLLEDVSRAIFISSSNPLLKELKTLEEFLPQRVSVRGIQYENRATVARLAHVNQEVRLMRDYDNPVDRNAIGVFLLNQQLGYLPQEIAQVLAPEFDTGTAFKASIVEIQRRNVPSVSIELSLA